MLHIDKFLCLKIVYPLQGAAKTKTKNHADDFDHENSAENRQQVDEMAFEESRQGRTAAFLKQGRRIGIQGRTRRGLYGPLTHLRSGLNAATFWDVEMRSDKVVVVLNVLPVEADSDFGRDFRRRFLVEDGTRPIFGSFGAATSQTLLNEVERLRRR